jgi:hypothetical protein
MHICRSAGRSKVPRSAIEQPVQKEALAAASAHTKKASPGIQDIVQSVYTPDEVDAYVTPQNCKERCSQRSTSVTSQLLSSHSTLGDLQCFRASQVTKKPPSCTKVNEGIADWATATKKDEQWKATLFDSLWKRVSLAPVEVERRRPEARQRGINLEGEGGNPWDCIPLVLPSLGERCTLV